MNTRKRTLALGLALALGAGGAGFAIAQGMPGGGQGGMGPGMMGGMMGGGQGGMGPGMMGGMMGGGQGGMGPGMMGGMMGGGMMPCPMMAEGMGMMSLLTPEQRDEMRELMREHRPAQFERMGQMMNLREDLMAVMRDSRPDPVAVQEQHARVAELHGEMMAEMVRMRNAMHDLLTDEQRQQLQEAAPPAGNPDDNDSHH
ncbi:Spy/CpxP family protein refolding chaperone [Halomonas sp. LBP4]|uniref:Spy/CpxP family protein refolding chaperone n=1 Tax=Halomonas sp. LBP4 TaxID=2044917 RepID=UPI000D760CB6|nr:Spy/CpxP family protein refolding chaperone [Halomonas sp. LBP4]PXX97211.1 hypothetical protein CR157_10665 [Halomonas sp. LBP4]